MQKRGQSTIFIAVAVIIVLILALFSYYSSVLSKAESPKDALAIPQTVEELKSAIRQCLDDSLAYSTYLVASHGGSMLETNTMEIPELGKIQMGYNQATDSINLPSEKEITKQISASVETEVERCANINENFPGLIKESNKPIVSVAVENNRVKAKLQYPVVIKQGRTEARVLETYLSSLDVDLLKLLKTANDLLETIKKDPAYLDLYFIQNAPVSITFLPLESQKGVFILTDEKSLIKNIPLSLVFGAQYK